MNFLVFALRDRDSTSNNKTVKVIRYVTKTILEKLFDHSEKSLSTF